MTAKLRTIMTVGVSVSGVLGCTVPDGAEADGVGEEASTDTSDPSPGCQRLEGSGQGDEPIWALRCGGGTNENVTGLGSDAQGNVYIGIDLNGSAEPFQIAEFVIEPGGSADILIIKLDADGEVVWVAHHGGPGSQYIEDLIPCGDDVVVRGSYTDVGTLDFGQGPLANEDFLAAFDGAQGSHLWTHEIELLTPDAHLTGGAMDCDAAGNLSVTGGYRESIDFGLGPSTSNDVYDGYVAGLDAMGVVQWFRVFDSVGAYYPTGRAIVRSEAGETVVVGQSNGTVDFGGGTIVTEGEGMVLAKLDAAGEHVWSEALGGPGLYYGWDIAEHSSGELALVGTFLDQIVLGDQTLTNVYPDQPIETTLYDAYLARLDAQGVPTSALPLASMGDDDVYGVDFEGDAVLVGGGYGGVFRVQQYLGEEPVWELELASLPMSFSFHYTLAPGALIVADSITEPLEFANGTLGPQTAGESSDFVIAKFSR